MDFAPVSNHGEEKSLQEAEAIESSLQLRNNAAKEYAIVALKQCGHSTRIPLLEYGSVIKLIEYLRHRNPDCGRTIDAYLGTLNATLKLLNNTTPDDLVRSSKEADEDQLDTLFLDLDDHWLNEFNSTATRSTKWATLKTFLVSNNVRKARLIKCSIRKCKKTIDYALTKGDCRRVLEQAKETNDKLLISLLIESLQRIGTINLLTWGDVQPHLAKGEEVFLIWIDPGRTKRNIGHWAPIGPLSTYYLRKRLAELVRGNNQPSEETRLLTNLRHLGRPVRTAALIQQVHRLMLRAGILGKKQGSKQTTRYEKHVHSFRKFGVVEMQRAGVNEQVIRFLIGQKRDTYSEWTDRYDELLEIYRKARPTLEQKDALADIVEYARSRGYSLDPKHLIRTDLTSAEISAQVEDIGAGPDPHPGNSQRVEATAAFYCSPKREGNVI